MFAAPMMMKSAAAGGGALVYVGGAAQGYNNGASSKTLSLTSLAGGVGSAPAQGDIVVVSQANSHQAGTPDLLTPGFTDIVTITFPYARVHYKVMGATPDTAVQIAGVGNNSNSRSIAAHVWRGINATPLDVAAVTATGTGTTNPNPPAITPVTSGAVILAFGFGRGSVITNTFNTPSDLGNFVTAIGVDINDAVVGVGSKLWTGGAFDPEAWTGTSGTDQWGAVVLALRPA